MSSQPTNGEKALGGGSDGSNNSNTDTTSDVFGGHPVTWILLPICCLALAAICIGVFRYRRRRRLFRGLLNTTTRQNDVEAGRFNRSRRLANGRWQWPVADSAPTGRRRAGLGIGSREEGLNELGEAPPAYTKNNVEDIELGDVMVAPPPIGQVTSEGTSELRHGLAGEGPSPPEYGEAPQSNDIASRTRSISGSTHPPEPAPGTTPPTPPPAVLPSP